MSAEIKVGEVWHRVIGEHIGEEFYEGAQLYWQEFVAVRVAAKGAWFHRAEFGGGKKRFALADGCRWAARTKAEALKQLIARKRRHLEILAQDTQFAEDTMSAAKEALENVQ